MNCPECTSKRLRRYNREGREYYCPKCRELFKITRKPVLVCYKCKRPIDDYSKAVLMGNGKEKHQRCRTPKKALDTPGRMQGQEKRN